MATFCRLTGMSPSEYRKLTLIEFGMFIEVFTKGLEE